MPRPPERRHLATTVTRKGGASKPAQRGASCGVSEAPRGDCDCVAESAGRNGQRSPAAISNAIASLYRENFGRGPRDARTLIRQDLVICALHDIFTPMERALIDAGREETVRQSRLDFQKVKRAQFVEVVEREVGRAVIAFMSQIHVNPDMGVEIFFLADDPA